MPISIIDRNILSFIKKINHLPTQQMDSLIVTAFLEYNHINTNISLVHDLSDAEKKLEQQFFAKWCQYQTAFDLENLIELFEFIISPAEKEVNGAVYTPRYIREYIVDEIFKALPEEDIPNVVIGDLSCGCGGFLITIAQKMHNQYGLAYDWIYENNIVGIDIAPYSVERAKILLMLLASLNEDKITDNINVFCQNSLLYNFDEIVVVHNRNGFDAVVGNPPYVSSAKMQGETKGALDRFETASSGKADLYIPFFQLAVDALRENGVLGYITVNNFYRSVNGRSLRKWFSRNEYYIKLIDFGGEQIFKSRSTYTCLCFVRKNRSGYIDYVKSEPKQLEDITKEVFTAIEYDRLNDQKGWLLATEQEANIIKKVENRGTPIGKLYPIVNGFATLNNKIYVFQPVSEDECTFTLKCKYGEFLIEKAICRDAIKPNILQSEKDIKRYVQKVIFPYTLEKDRILIIPENEMIRKYPFTYQYLAACKNDLAKRDKGKRDYLEWYGYGRSQALNVHGYKLLFPYIAERPRFILCDRKDLLFYNGYAICSDKIEDLLLLKKILETTLFWDYIYTTSKPYSNGYFALAKNYVKYFGIPNLTSDQKKYILSESDSRRINEYIKRIYFD